MAIVRQALECEQQRLWQAYFPVPVSINDGVKPAYNGKQGGRVLTEPQEVRAAVRSHLQRVI